MIARHTARLITGGSNESSLAPNDSSIASTIAPESKTQIIPTIESVGNCCFRSPLSHMGCNGAKFKLDSDQIVCDDRVNRENVHDAAFEEEMVDGLGRPLPLGLVMAEFGLILIAACQMACAMTKALAILEPSPGSWPTYSSKISLNTRVVSEAAWASGPKM
jgi:hypothetical protein